MPKRWVLRHCDEEKAASLADKLSISPITAQVLIHRGLHSADDARSFLQPELSLLSEPDLLPDIDAAVLRIHDAVIKKEKILIYGDYDVDGITCTALLLHFFRLLNADAEFYIPHRVDEGYGLNLDAIDQFKQRRVDLVITVDCGVTSCREVAAAQDAGIDMIITDHHEPGIELPPACAVVNPKLTQSKCSFREFSGVGVAFKLCWAVAKRFSPGKRVTPEFRQFLIDSMALVALGTIADVVPLKDENRVLAKYGLQALSATKCEGLKALLSISGLEGKRLSARNVSFGIAPRLNAAGRLSQASLGVELLTTDSKQRAMELAEILDKHNRQRQKVQSNILKSAREMLEADSNLAQAPAIVLASEDWHAGVIGIVASRIAEEYNRPTVMIALDGDMGKGSARSIPGFHLYDAIKQCEDLLLAFGGHVGAAGLSVESKNIPALREKLAQVTAASLKKDDFQPSVEIDADILLSMLSRKLIDEFENLEPFGESNPPPVLAASNLSVAGLPRLMGAKGQHVSFIVRQGDTSVRAVGFGMGDLYDQISECSDTCHIAFAPRLNCYNGNESVELEIHDLRVDE